MASWYSSKYDADETIDDLIEIMKKHGEKWKGKYYIYQKNMKKSVGFVVSSTKTFKVLPDKKKNLKLYDNLLKHFQIKIFDRKKCGEVEHIEMIVYNNFN